MRKRTLYGWFLLSAFWILQTDCLAIITHDGGSSDDYFTSLAIDSQSNVYSVGHFNGTFRTSNVDTNSSNNSFDGFIIKKSNSMSPLWTAFLNSTDDDFIYAVAVDKLDNLIVSGTFSASTTFDACTLTKPLSSNSSTFIAQFLPTGTCSWAISMGSTIPADLAVDTGNNIYLTGSYSTTTNVGGSNLPNSIGNTLDWYIAKYSSTGSHVWSFAFQGSGSDVPYSISAMNDSIAIVGTYASTDFALQSLNGTTVIPAASVSSLLIVKMNSAGYVQWHKSFPGTQTALFDSAIDSQGALIAGGSCQNTTFDCGGFIINCQTNGLLLMKMAADGSMMWCQTFTSGVATGQRISGVFVNFADDVFFTGIYLGAMNFSGTILPFANYPSLFLASYGTFGVYRWATAYPCNAPGSFYDNSKLVTSDTVFMVSASFQGNVSFESANPVSLGYDDGVLATISYFTASPTVTPSMSPSSSPSVTPYFTVTPSSTPSSNPTPLASMTPSGSPDSESSSVPPETIAAASGAAGGSSCLLIIVVAGVCWFRKRKKKDDSDSLEDEASLEEPSNQ